MSSKVLKEVKNFFEKKITPEEADSILAAVSGGVDSMVMLDVLDRLKEDYNFAVSVAHLDHCLRGESSREDARFVREQSEKRNLKFSKGKRKVKQLARKKSMSTEEAAREARYEFLDATARGRGSDFIALGHNKDDQAETVLINLIRGAGLKGLSGIEPVRDKYIRPLLGCRREEIKTYARNRNLSWRKDETNEDVKYRRNKIRNVLLPHLEEEYNPNIKDTLSRTAKLLSKAHQFINRQVEQKWSEILTVKMENGVRFKYDKLKEAHPCVKREVIRKAIKVCRGDLSDISYSHVISVIKELDEDKPRSRIDLPGKLVFEKTREYAGFRTEKRKKADSFSYTLPSEGKERLEEIGWEFELIPMEEEIESYPEDRFEEFVDRDKITPPLKVKNRSRGDRFKPLGMEGEKKLKDFFIDENIPYHQRDRIPIVLDRKGIVWVVGLRLDERYRIDEATKRVLKIEARKI